MYKVGIYRDDHANVLDAHSCDAIYWNDEWVEDIDVPAVISMIGVGVIASGREDNMQYCLLSNTDEMADIPAVDWDGNVEAIFEEIEEAKEMVMEQVTEFSGGLTISGNEDVVKDLVESLRSTYDSIGSDMPKALNDVVFQLESRLGMIDNGEKKEYTVVVNRIGYSQRSLKITASNDDDAIYKAIESAGDYEFSEHSSEYEIESISCD